MPRLTLLTLLSVIVFVLAAGCADPFRDRSIDRRCGSGPGEPVTVEALMAGLQSNGFKVARSHDCGGDLHLVGGVQASGVADRTTNVYCAVGVHPLGAPGLHEPAARTPTGRWTHENVSCTLFAGSRDSGARGRLRRAMQVLGPH